MEAPVRTKPIVQPRVEPQRKPGFEPKRWCPIQVEPLAP